MNNLYEYGNSCDVIIRCNIERVIEGKTYAAGEPYTILRDVFCSLVYKSNAAESRDVKNSIANREARPDMINLSNVVLSDKILNLIATKQPASKTLVHVEYRADKGVFYLPETSCSSVVYAYDSDLNPVNCRIDGDKVVGDFIENEVYTIFYEKELSKSFDFITPHYGHFSLEIVAKGNTDKNTSSMYMSFPAVSLMSMPVFNLRNDNILSAPLQFECVYKSQKNPCFGFED